MLLDDIARLQPRNRTPARQLISARASLAPGPFVVPTWAVRCLTHMTNRIPGLSSATGLVRWTMGKDMITFVPVSVPEKTLEHWSSQYLTYRYRSRAGLWWPTVGYWTGELTTSARQHGVNSCEIGFSRVNNGRPGWWFANWMRVMTAAEVGRVIGHRPHRGRCQQGSIKQLVRFDVQGAGAPTPHWASRVTPEPIRWRDFWRTLQTCGQPDWPQIVVVPAYRAGRRRVLERADLQKIFTQAHELAASADETGDEAEQMGEPELEYFEPDGEGNFRRLEVLDGQGPDEDSTELTSGERHALAVHLAGSLISPRSQP